MTTAVEYAAGLRELADWIEAHPEVDTPSREFTVYSLNTKQEAADCLRALTPCKKEYKADNFFLSREFGPITLSFMFYRNAICTKRVIGTKEVGTQVIPSRFTPEEIIPAHTEEIYEWDCGESLLAQASPPSESPAEETLAERP